MKIRILGARQGESRDSHFGSLLVDETLALDAGCLTGSLSLAEQLALTAVLVTHHHLDHVKDLATLGHPPYAIAYKGYEVQFCSKQCLFEFAKDPEKYVRMVNPKAILDK